MNEENNFEMFMKFLMGGDCDNDRLSASLTGHFLECEMLNF